MPGRGWSLSRFIRSRLEAWFGGYRRLDDPYLNWLYWSHASMTHRGNPACFDRALREMPELPILEIGTWAGHSTNLINYLKRKNGRRVALYTVDCCRFEAAASFAAIPHTTISAEAYRRHIAEAALANLRAFNQGDLPHPLALSSAEFFEAWQQERELTDSFGQRLRLGGRFGFCFVDGDHSREGSGYDLEQADRFLAPGGFLFLDDSGDGSGWGVAEHAQALKRHPNYRLVMKNPHYLFQKRG